MRIESRVGLYVVVTKYVYKRGDVFNCQEERSKCVEILPKRLQIQKSSMVHLSNTRIRIWPCNTLYMQ